MTKERTQILQSYGLKVIRFKNDDALSRYGELIAYFPTSKLPQSLSFPASGCVINFAWVLI